MVLTGLLLTALAQNRCLLGYLSLSLLDLDLHVIIFHPNFVAQPTTCTRPNVRTSLITLHKITSIGSVWTYVVLLHLGLV